MSGEGKPSLILSRIRNLSQDKCSNEVIKTVFLDQLPDQCRSALALSEVTDLNKLAELANRFLEVAGSSTTSAVSQNKYDEEVLKRIDALSAKVEVLSQNRFRPNQSAGSYKNKNRSRSNGRNFNNNNNNDKSNNFNFKNKNFNNSNFKNGKFNNNKEDDSNNKGTILCFYHSKWGSKATNCVPPCIIYQGPSFSGN